MLKNMHTYSNIKKPPVRAARFDLGQLRTRQLALYVKVFAYVVLSEQLALKPH